MKYGLEEEDLQQIISIISGHSEVEEIILYGSRAMGNFREGSDIDLAIRGEKLSHKAFMDLLTDLDEIEMLNKIDVVELSKVEDPEFLDHVKRRGITLWKRQPMPSHQKTT